MKIRLDYVTNSSSSSYIVAFKNRYDFDEETLKKYPFLKHYNGEMDRILHYLSRPNWSDTELDFEINTKEELDNFCLEYYCWNGEDFEDWLKTKEAQDHYFLMKNYLDKGYSILKFDIDYSDDYLKEEIHNLINSNDGRAILIEHDY